MSDKIINLFGSVGITIAVALVFVATSLPEDQVLAGSILVVLANVLLLVMGITISNSVWNQNAESASV